MGVTGSADAIAAFQKAEIGFRKRRSVSERGDRFQKEEIGK
jgi:hypothetical protein